MENRFEKITHPFAPIFKGDSQILILGSLPSVKSRENEFYYGHPRNRFWRVLAKIFAEEIPCTIQEKIEFLLRNKIALWDVIHSCEIRGSSDSSIKNAVPNRIEEILCAAKIRKIILNGGAAFSLYKKFFGGTLEQEYGAKAIRLPSTSPANAACSLETLVEIWRKEFD